MKNVRFNWPAIIVLGLLATFWMSAVSHAQTDVVSGVKAVHVYIDKRPTQKHAILSTGECVAGIALSQNPVGAAAVGLPVLALGNGLGYLLRNENPGPYSPNQDVASFFHNVGRYLEKHPTLLQDASGTFCMSYGLSRHGRAKLSKAKPQGGNTGSNNPSGTQPGDGGSGNAGGSGSGSSGSGSGSGCQQDCGLPGNGGVNGGHDGKKPPFPGHPHRPGV